MPTAVEFNSGALENAFLKIDADFLKLSTASTDNFLKIEDTAQIKHDISIVGNFFLKLDDDFLKIDDTALKIDSLVLKLLPASPTDGEGGASAVQSDFLKLDAFLKTSAGDLGSLGSDFLKLDMVPNLKTLTLEELKVSNDFLKLGTDMTDVGAAFIKLGDGLIALGDGLDLKLDKALKIVGGELLKVGLAFDAISLDNHKLGTDFEILSRGGTTDASTNAGPVPTGALGSDFYKLEQDFKYLNQTLDNVHFGTLLGAFSEAGGKFNNSSIDGAGQLLGGHGGSIFDHG